MFHKKLTGRLLAGVLSVITIFGSMPVTAFADEDIIISEDNNQENASEISDEASDAENSGGYETDQNLDSTEDDENSETSDLDENAALEENSVEALKEDILETEEVLVDNVRSNGALESGQDGFSWILDTDGTLTISVDTDIVADGKMKDYASYSSNNPLYSNGSSVKQIVVEDGVTSIGNYAFYYAPNVTGVSLPESLETIGEYAFGCYPKSSSLTEIEIPEGVTDLGESCFYNREGLQTINLPSSLTSIGSSCFKNCKTLEYITIPDKISVINSNTFDGCAALTSVNFAAGSSLTEIKSSAFYDCAVLENITIPDSVTAIRSGAFRGCKKAFSEGITFGSSFTTLEGSVFSDCQALKSADLSEAKLTEIPSSLFAGCSCLESISLPSGIETIGASAFSKTALKNIELPAKLSTIKSNAFSESALEEVSFEAGNKCTSIEYNAFYNCKSLNTISLPATLTDLGQEAFKGCEALTAITIPAGIRFLRSSTFDGCIQLSSVEFADESTLKSLYDYAFRNDIALVNITLPKSLESFDIKAFDGCKNLEKVMIDGFGEAGYQDSGTYYSDGSGAVYKVSDKSLYFKPAACVIGIGDDVTILSSAFYKDNTDITTLRIPANIEVIDEEALSGCSNLETISFEEGSKLKTIKNKAFYNCKKLKNIDFSNCSLLETIGSSAFYYCSSIESIDLSSNSNLKSIGNNAFEYCTNLKALSFPEGLTSIGENIIRGDNLLKELTIPSTVSTMSGYTFSSTKLSMVNFAVNEETKKASLTTIPANAFNSCAELSEIIIPEGVATIEANAFTSSSKLKSVTLPATLTAIKDNAFQNCFVLESIALPEGLKTLGSRAFSNCYALTEIHLPDSLTGLGDNCFYMYERGKTLLSSVTFGENWQVSTLPYAFFSGCNALKSIELPYQISSFYGNYTSLSSSYCPFYHCDQLAEVNMTEDPSGESELYSELGQLKKRADDSIYFTPPMFTGDVSIPDDMTAIPKDYFKNKIGMEEIVIPARITSIGDNAFYNCSGLKKISFEKGSKLTSIGADAFYGCSSLEEIILPDTVTSVGKDLFSGCSALVKAVLPKNLKTLPNYTFYNCVKLVTLTLPSAPVEIGNSCFEGCELLEVSIPASVTSIGNNAFNKSGIKSVTVSDKVKSVGTNAFKACRKLTTVTFNAETVTDYAFQNCSALTKVTLGKATKSINQYAFDACTLLNDVNLGGVTYIGSYAFRGCKLTTVNIPNGVTSIYAATFANCTELTTVSIPASVTSIKFPSSVSETETNSAFYGCKKLKAINIVAANTKYMSISGLVYEKASGELLYNPKASGVSSPAKYILVDGVTVLSSRYISEDMTVLNVPKSVTTIDSDVHTVAKNLQKVNFASGSALTTIRTSAFEGCTKLTSINLNACAKLETIESRSFYNCTGLKSVSLPASLNRIGDAAFMYSGLTQVAFPKGLTELGTYAFADCPALKSANISAAAGLTELPYETFARCEVLSSVNLGKTLEEIYDSAFVDDIALSSISLPDALTRIGKSAFEGNVKLKSITFNKALESIGDCAFNGCGALTALTLPVTVNEIGEGALADCENLQTLSISGCNELSVLPERFLAGDEKLNEFIIPESITDIEEEAFWDCALLKSIIIPQKVENIDVSAFRDCKSLVRISVDENNKHFCSIEGALYKGTYDDENDIFIPEILIYCPPGWTNKSDTFVIPYGVKTINEKVLTDSPKVKYVEIPATVETISPEAFKACTTLKRVTFLAEPDGSSGSRLTKIPESAFQSCTDLEGVIFKGETALSDIDEAAFYDCNSLKYILFENNTCDVNIGEKAFYGYEPTSKPNDLQCGDAALQALYNDNGNELLPLGDVASKAFYGCRSLEQVRIGKSASSIAENAFRSCHSLAAIKVDDGNSDFSADDGVLYAGESLWVYPAGRSGGSYSIKAGTEIINSYAFAFADELKQLTVPSSLTTIKTCAFMEAKELIDIDFSAASALTKIEYYAFFQIPRLEKADFSVTSIAAIPKQCFINCEALLNVALPAATKEIGEEAFKGCKALTEFTAPGVITIGKNAFTDCQYLVTLTAPAVNSIGDNAFSNCYRLTGFNLPAGLTSLGKCAFSNCRELTTLTIPVGLKEIPREAFSCCYGLADVHFALPSALEKIEFEAFYRCSALKEIDSLPEGITTLSSHIFDESAVEQLELPASLTTLETGSTTIGSTKYYGSFLLSETPVKKVIIKNPNLVLQNNMFYNCSGGTITLYSVTAGENKSTAQVYAENKGISGELKDHPGFLYADIGSEPKIEEPEDEKLIEGSISGDFENNKWLHWELDEDYKLTLSLNSSIEGDDEKSGEFRYYEFDDSEDPIAPWDMYLVDEEDEGFIKLSEHIKEIEIGEGIVNLPDSAFYDYYSLKTVNIASTVESIERFAFAGCSVIENISIPAKVKAIDEYAFAYCYKLKSLEIEADSELEIIGKNAFYNCSELAAITISASVKEIGESAFYGCKNLKAVTFEEYSELKTIGTFAFEYASRLSSIVLPAKLESIGNGAFEYCSALETVSIPASVTAIGDNAFNSCYALNAVTIEAGGLKSIGKRCFENDSKLSLITLPDTTESIGESAFKYCSAIRNFHIPSSLKDLGGCFGNTYDTDIYSFTIGEGNESFKLFNGSLYKLIVLEDGTSSLELVYLIRQSADGVYYISKDKLSLSSEELIYMENISSFEVEEGNPVYETDEEGNLYLKGKYTLVRVPGQSTGEFIVADTVEKIDSYAFDNCKKITSVSMSDKVYQIGAYCFTGCTLLEKVRLSSSIKVLPDYCFSSCVSLQDIKLPMLEHIGSYAFNGCRALKKLSIPDSVISLGYSCFVNCSQLKEVRLSNSLTAIPDWAFEYCKSLVSIEIPEGVAELGECVFYGCNNLNKIWLPDTITKLKATEEKQGKEIIANAKIFYGCSADLEVIVPLSSHLLGYSIVYENYYYYYYPYNSSVLKEVDFTPEEDIKYTISYMLDVAKGERNSLENPNYYRAHDTGRIELKPALRDDDVFIGWYTDPDFIEEISVITGLDQRNYVLYPRFEGDEPASVNSWGDICIEDRAGFKSIDDVPEGIWVAGIPKETSYTGKNITFDIRVYDNKKLLKLNTDYKIAYRNNKNAALSTAEKNQPSVTISFASKEYKSLPKIIEKFSILPRKLGGYGNITASDEWINYIMYELEDYSDSYGIGYMGDGINLQYKKSAQKMKPKLSCLGVALKENTDYTISFPDKLKNYYGDEYPVDYISPGMYYAQITGKNNYEGSLRVYYSIAPKSAVKLSSAKIENFVSSIVYDLDSEYCVYDLSSSSSNRTPRFEQTSMKLSVTTGSGNSKVKTYLKEGTDYSLVYSNNTAAGKATVTIKGLGNYYGSIKKTYKITARRISNAKIHNLITPLTYCGLPLKQETMWMDFTQKVNKVNVTEDLLLGRDYTLTYTNNVKAGKATVEIVGCGAYEGTVKKTYKINQYDWSKDNQADKPLVEVIVADGTDSCEMVKNDKNGAKPKVEVRFRGKTLTEGVDYSVSYKNNKTFAAPDPLQLNKAPAVIIAGKGCFKGNIIKYFTITEKLP